VHWNLKQPAIGLPSHLPCQWRLEYQGPPSLTQSVPSLKTAKLNWATGVVNPRQPKRAKNTPWGCFTAAWPVLVAAALGAGQSGNLKILSVFPPCPRDSSAWPSDALLSVLVAINCVGDQPSQRATAMHLIRTGTAPALEALEPRARRRFWAG
jgi:hypothetical protein